MAGINDLGLMESGFIPEDAETQMFVDRWRQAPRNGFLMSRSVDYLRRSGQLRDLDFILEHFDDVFTACGLSEDIETSLAVAAEV